MKMFADDTKLYNNIQSKEDCDTLQSDLNKLSAWSSTWLLDFNAGKCVVLKVKKKHNYVYTLNGIALKEVEHQKDLGIHISNTLLPSKHISEICKKANQRIGMIKRCFTGLTNKKIKTLYIL